MISFVWGNDNPLAPGTGGSENFTIGQIRELNQMGVETEIITVGLGINDGRNFFPDIKFRSLAPNQISKIDNTVVFCLLPMDITTRHSSFVILHYTPKNDEISFIKNATKDKRVIVPSRFSRELWAQALDISKKEISVVYPFAERVFSQVKSYSNKSKKARVLFASRLTPDKGIYTFMAAIHLEHLIDPNKFIFTVTSNGLDRSPGKLIKELMNAHPHINLIESVKSPKAMAKLMTSQDIVIVPTTNLWWHEPFGMVSVEAQHAGCRVIATRSGGLPETNCGYLNVIKPDNPVELAKAIILSADQGRLSDKQRQAVAKKFTVEQSVKRFLRVINYRSVKASSND